MGKHYDFCSFFVIPALTFLLAAGNSLTAVNFSVIGNREGQRGFSFSGVRSPETIFICM